MRLLINGREGSFSADHRGQKLAYVWNDIKKYHHVVMGCIFTDLSACCKSNHMRLLLFSRVKTFQVLHADIWSSRSRFLPTACFHLLNEKQINSTDKQNPSPPSSTPNVWCWTHMETVGSWSEKIHWNVLLGALKPVDQSEVIRQYSHPKIFHCRMKLYCMVWIKE